MASKSFALVEWVEPVNTFNVVSIDSIIKDRYVKYKIDSQYKVLWNGKRHLATLKKIGYMISFIHLVYIHKLIREFFNLNF